MSYLHVRLVEAVGLPSTDLLGFADPYCKVFLKNVTHLSENKIFKSEAKKKSTDPIFDCAASLNVSAKDLENGLLTIDIYDHDKAKKTDDELGSASLPLSYFKENKQFQGWLPIRSTIKNNHDHHHHHHHHHRKHKNSHNKKSEPTKKKERSSSYHAVKNNNNNNNNNNGNNGNNNNNDININNTDIPDPSPLALSESGTSFKDDTDNILSIDSAEKPPYFAFNNDSNSKPAIKQKNYSNSLSSKKSPKIYRPRIDSSDSHSLSLSQQKYKNKLTEQTEQKYREQAPDIQFLNGTDDINAAPPSFPISPQQYNLNKNNIINMNKTSNLTKQIKFNEAKNTQQLIDKPYFQNDADNDPGVSSLESTASIHAKLSFKNIGSPPDHLNNLINNNINNDIDDGDDEKKQKEKKKKLAAVTQEFMKMRTNKLEISRTETFANNGIIDKNELTKPEIVNASPMSKYNEIQEEETLYDLPTKDTMIHQKVANTVAPSMQHGRRNKDSGRIFIVVHYQKSFHFGKMSNQDVKKTRIKNLKIHNQWQQTIPITIFTLTFNCGNCNLSDLNHSLSQWLPNNGNIDLYALAFQELNEKTKKKGDNDDDIDDNEEEEDEKGGGGGGDDFDINQQTEIENYFLNHLGVNYVTIAHYKMWQTRLYLFTKKEYFDCISNVTSHFHITGIGGIVKNKGAVAISLEFDGISLCFLSCHLAAHQSKIDERNRMYKKLCKNIKVGWPKQPLLGQFHFLFFMGDLNYRVNYFGQKQGDKTSDDLFQTVCQILKQITISSSKQQQKDRQNKVDKTQITGGGILKQEQTPYSGILKYDQLSIAKFARKAFVDFHEHHIKFPPSFKVKRQIGIHYISQRLPAWTDRILWRCPKSFDEKQEYKVKNYKIYDKVSLSDHKPVSCTFIIPTWKRPCGISDDCTKAIIHFRNVSAANLRAADVNGKSDPFIHFPRQLILEKYIQSKRVNKTLNPKWKNKHLKPLIMIRNSLPFLQRALLLFQIRDHDKFSANDLIGCGYLELKYSVEKLNKWVKFKEYLTLDGKDAGIFMGEIKLEYKIKSKRKYTSNS